MSGSWFPNNSVFDSENKEARISLFDKKNFCIF